MTSARAVARRALQPWRLGALRRQGLAELAAGGGEERLASVLALLGRPPRDATARTWVTRLEARRRQLLASDEPVHLLDGQVTTVGETCLRTSKEPAWCLLLFELVRAVGPRSVVEMGTSVGVSGSYLAAALAESSRGTLVTLDGLADVAAVTQRDLEGLGLQVRTVVGPFDQTLPGVLRDEQPLEFLFIDGHHQEEPTKAYFELALPHLAPGALVVFDDIGWTDGMRRAWAEIRKHPRLDLAVDLGLVGVVRVAVT